MERINGNNGRTVIEHYHALDTKYFANIAVIPMWHARVGNNNVIAVL